MTPEVPAGPRAPEEGPAIAARTTPIRDLHLETVLWPFDRFGVEVELREGVVGRFIVTVPRERPYPECVHIRGINLGANAFEHSGRVVRTTTPTGFGFDLPGRGIVPDDAPDMDKFAVHLRLLGAVRLADALMSRNVDVREREQPTPREARRSFGILAESAGIYEVRVNGRRSLGDVATAANAGRGLREGFPRRRHLVRPHERRYHTRRGVELRHLAGYARGGQSGPGPGYLLTLGIIRPAGDTPTEAAMRTQR